MSSPRLKSGYLTNLVVDTLQAFECERLQGPEIV